MSSSTLTRPSSADWRAMSSVNKSTSESSIAFQIGSIGGSNGPSLNHRASKKKAIGLRSSDVRQKPFVPQPIRKCTIIFLN